MNIETVKINSDGWLVNDSLFVPNDSANRYYQLIQDWINAGNTPDPEFTAEEIAAKTIDLIAAAIQVELDREAQLLGYDSIHTAVTYASETSVTKFSDDGKSFRKWRSKVWEYCYAILTEYEAGNIPEPTIEEMIAGMPARV